MGVRMRYLLAILLIAFCAPLLGSPPSSGQVRRLAIDVGSESITYKIADVDPLTERVVHVIVDEYIPVPLLQSLQSSGTEIIDSAVAERALEIIEGAANQAVEAGVTEVAAVGTEPLRRAKNADSFIKRILQQTGIQILVISEREQAILGFVGSTTLAEFAARTLLVWDLGGGSMAFTARSQGEYAIYTMDFGTEAFKSEVISKIKHENAMVVHSPNPLSQRQIDQVVALAKDKAVELPLPIREKVAEPKTVLLGIGALAFLQAGDKRLIYSLEDLRDSLSAKAGKDDKELGDGPYASLIVTNLALAVGFMESLNVRYISLLRVSLADGLLISPAYLFPFQPPASK